MAAAPLTPTSAQRLNLLDLPTVILSDIFNYFKHEWIDSHGRRILGSLYREEAQQRRREVRKARLVCHAFCKLVSPHLFPVLRLPLERSSLDIVNLLLGQPAVLKGIQVIEISTLYRPKEVADSVVRFVKRRLDDLAEANRRCLDLYESGCRHDRESDAECEICASSKKAYLDATVEYTWICFAGQHFVRSYSKNYDSERPARYRRVFERGYTEYRKRHDEQVQIIEDGSFVEAIAALVSHIPHPCSLVFPDETSSMYRHFHDDPTLVLTNTDELLRFMSFPHDWRVLEALEGGCDLIPVSLLATLPIAIRQHSLKLEGLQINTFPHLSGHFTFDRQSDGHLWDDFNASCKQLKSVVFSGGHKGIRHEHLQGEDKAAIDQCVGAMISSPHLEYMHLGFYALALNDGRNGETHVGKHRNIDIGATIATIQYPFLREAHIGCISIRQADLERFCNGLGESLQSLHMWDIEMRGSWIGTLDILHAKYSERCREARCQISLASVFDGEFGPRPLDDDSFDWLFPQDMMDEDAFAEPVLVTRAVKYVNGDAEVSENPLRGIS